MDASPLPIIDREIYNNRLGLYISKRIIETHGGKVWAENNLQETGATFSFSIALD